MMTADDHPASLPPKSAIAGLTLPPLGLFHLSGCAAHVCESAIFDALYGPERDDAPVGRF